MNGQMFLEQQKRWLSFPKETLRKLHFIIIDDGSPEKPAVDFLLNHKNRLQIDIYRIDIDILWNLEGALNLGALFCVNEWMFMSDMDHFLPLESINKIFSLKASRFDFFMFKRLKARKNWTEISELELRNPHKGTFLLNWHLYWEVGGRNEDLCGFYSVGWAFRNKLRKYGRQKQINAFVVGYSSDEISDSASPAPRPNYQERLPIRRDLKNEQFHNNLPQNPIRFPWHKAYSSAISTEQSVCC